MAIDYQWYKESGICVQCLRYDASPGKVRCEVCLAKNAEVARKRREKMKSVSRAEEYRKMRESRKEQGDCVEWYDPLTAWINPLDRVYMSKVFTFNSLLEAREK